MVVDDDDDDDDDNGKRINPMSRGGVRRQKKQLIQLAQAIRHCACHRRGFTASPLYSWDLESSRHMMKFTECVSGRST